MQMQMQMGNFMKNISMLGAALLITYFGAGPCSLDNKSKNSKAENLNPKL
jgi:putative oxidoreductase